MGLSKQALRDAVRNQLDVDDEELPNGRLDLYLADSFQQTVQRERKWPFLEFEWEITIADGEPHVLPVDFAAADSVYLYGSAQLQFLAHGFAEEQFGRDGSIGSSVFYSLRNGKIYLWPAPEQDAAVLLISGWRKPADFLEASAAAEPDCDSRLHIPLIYNACALAMAANEDEVINSLYYQMWQRGVDQARVDIMRTDPGRRRIFASGVVKGVSKVAAVFGLG